MSDSEREPDVRFQFGHEVYAGRQARQQLAALWWDSADLIFEDVRLAASEMVTNVIVHTAGGGELRVWDSCFDVPLRVEVEDSDPTPPVLLDGPHAFGGLAIVAAVSDDWGYELHPSGKVVWAEFSRYNRSATPTRSAG